jgi:hypothetical protein
MSDEDNGSFGRRRRWVGVGVGAAALAAAIAVLLALSTGTAAPGRSSAPATTAASTSSASASSTPSALGVKQSAPETTPTVDADPAALADLSAVAATLTTPITLTSPAGWDRWLPAGKPYPGADTADDMSTCPRLSDRLGAALGTKMSYWTGTLPGPGGCTWATVPLYVGPNAPNYPYLTNVDFQADGTTTEQLSEHLYRHQGRLCPGVAVPAAGAGAYLVRCEELDGITYTVITRDTRTAGIWSLSGSARSDAGRPATDVLRPVIEGAVAAFGRPG